MDSKNYLTTKEIAARLLIKETTVRDWIKSKRLKAYKAGKQWRVLESDLQEFLTKPSNN